MAREARTSEAVEAPPITRAKSTAREYAEALGVALLMALVIRTFVVQAFKIPSGSMLSTLQIGDHILVNKFIYGPRFEIPLTQWSLGQLPGFRDPQAGDVIVFIFPGPGWPNKRSGAERDKDFIKRVIAVAGQTVEVRRKQVYIDGKPWDDPHVQFSHGNPIPNMPPDRSARPCGQVRQGDPGEDCAPFTVPAGHVFVMGDNRDESFDSRFWGPVPIEDVKGLAMVIYWSWDGERWVVRWDRLGRLVF